ncbi:MAG: hypothetical protein RR825_04830 [Ruthenibacterium sp.]
MQYNNTDAITAPALLQCFLPDQFPTGKLVYRDADGNALFAMGSAADFSCGLLEDSAALIPAVLLDDAQRDELDCLLIMQKKYEDTPLRIVQLTQDAIVISHTEQPQLFVCVAADTLGALTAAHIASMGAGDGVRGSLEHPFTGYLSEDGDFILY